MRDNADPFRGASGAIPALLLVKGAVNSCPLFCGKRGMFQPPGRVRLLTCPVRAP